MRRVIAATATAASLLLAGCQNPDGSTNWGNTLLLGAGLGTAAALVAGAASDQPQHHHGRGYGRGYGRGGYAAGYGGRPYRGGW